MDANAFRQYYEYHFAENRKIWDRYITSLTPEQFTRAVSYSHGSIRNQVVHLINADRSWFIELRSFEFPEPFDPPLSASLEVIRATWDGVEHEMRQYLDKLDDDMLFVKPFPYGEDKDLIIWQVLLHVVNHGTDHRAQILRLLNDLGMKTGPQDYIFYVYEHP